MMNLKTKLMNIVFGQIKDYPKLTIALSGGLDSMVLLHLIKKIKDQFLPNLNLKAIHIHHGLSKNADKWQQHCQYYCEQWQIPYLSIKVVIDKKQKNIEAQARIARYQAFQTELNTQDVLCTAQHLDDQVETFFLALKRGSGLSGLSAMPKTHQKYNFLLLRPLLSVSRSELEFYAQQNQICWVEDESNQDQYYDRNFLRASVLPLLNNRFEQFNQMVERSISHCQTQNELLHQLLSEQLSDLIQVDSSLNILPLINKNELERNAILRFWLEKIKVQALSQIQLQQLWQTIALAKKDANPKLIIENFQFRRFQNRLYALPLYLDLSNFKFDWDMKTTVNLPDQLGQLEFKLSHGNCRLPTKNEKVSIRFFAKPQNYTIVGRLHSRSLTKIWQEQQIPPWQRSRIPFIFYNETLICAVNQFVTQAGKGEEICFILS